MSENTRDTIEKNLIQNILVLQEIKKEPDYKNSLNYVKVSRKISELIWLLFDAVFASENSDISDFCDEVPEKIKFIINNFVPKDENTIINYILHILKQGIDKEKGKENYNRKLGGQNITDYEYEKLKKIEKTVEKYGLDLSQEENIQKLSRFSGYSVKLIKSALTKLNYSVSSVDAGNYVNVLANNNNYDNENCFDEELYSEEIDVFEECYQSKRDWGDKSTKYYVSKLITRKILKQLGEPEKASFTLLSKYDFVDKDLLNSWVKKEKLPKQNEIAMLFGRDKTDASRTIKRFEDDCKKIIKGKINYGKQ